MSEEEFKELLSESFSDGMESGFDMAVACLMILYGKAKERGLERLSRQEVCVYFDSIRAEGLVAVDDDISGDHKTDKDE